MGRIAGAVDIERTLECLQILQDRGQLPGSAITVADTATIDHTYSGGVLSSAVVAGSIGNTQLVASGITRSKLAAGSAFAWVINGAGGLLSEVSPTLGRVICTDGNGLPLGSAITQAQLESALAGRTEVVVTAQTVVNVALPSASEQTAIDIRFVPSQDDVMFDCLVSTDGGSTYDNSNAQYAYVGHINNGTGTTTGFDTPASDRIRMEYDNGTANAGVGNLSTEGISGRIVVHDRGNVSPARWGTISWDLRYRNALSQERTVRGSGFRQNGARVTHLRFQFENAGAFSGAYAVTQLMAQ